MSNQDLDGVIEGQSSGIDEVSRYAGSDLGYVVQLERYEGPVEGHTEDVVVALRSTTIFRREDDGWRIAHRHADPIVTPRPRTGLPFDRLRERRKRAQGTKEAGSADEGSGLGGRRKQAQRTKIT